METLEHPQTETSIVAPPARVGGRRLSVVSISIEYPNPSEPGRGLFVRARLQALAKSVDLRILSPIAFVDYSNPQRRWLGFREIPRQLRDGSAEVCYPRWFYPPRGGFLTAFCLFFRLLRPIYRLNRQSTIDVLDAHFVHPDGVATALAAMVLRKPFVVTARGCELSHGQCRLRRFWMGWAIRRAARVITVSDNLAQFTVAMGADPARVKVIPNGIDTDRFFPRDRMECRKRHAIALRSLVILSAGDLAEIKGHHRVIAALQAIRGNGTDAELLIAGGIGRSGRYAEVLRDEVSRRGLEKHVRFLGEVQQEQLAELMSAADVFCLASSREGCPNVVIESLACGTPVVATDVGAVRQLVSSDRYGYIAPVDQPPALQEALERSLGRRWNRDSIAAWGGSRGWQQVANEVAAEIRQAVHEAAQAKPPRTVIVNADDLGINPVVNDAIFDLMARNRVTSATLMANGPALDDAVRGAREFSLHSFGIHLNLTEFEPLTRGAGAKLLTNADGRFDRGIVRATPSPALLRAAYEEFQAQIDRLISMGVRISHIDSHHHVHTTAFLFPVIKAIQRRYGIRKIRLSKNIYDDEAPCMAALRVKKVLYNRALRLGGETTEGFTDLVSFCNAARKHRISHRTIELMVHPGAPKSAREAALLASDWEDTLPFPVQRLSYNDLFRKRAI